MESSALESLAKMTKVCFQSSLMRSTSPMVSCYRSSMIWQVLMLNQGKIEAACSVLSSVLQNWWVIVFYHGYIIQHDISRKYSFKSWVGQWHTEPKQYLFARCSWSIFWSNPFWWIFCDCSKFSDVKPSVVLKYGTVPNSQQHVHSGCCKVDSVRYPWRQFLVLLWLMHWCSLPSGVVADQARLDKFCLWWVAWGDGYSTFSSSRDAISALTFSSTRQHETRLETEQHLYVIWSQELPFNNQKRDGRSWKNPLREDLKEDLKFYMEKCYQLMKDKVVPIP